MSLGRTPLYTNLIKFYLGTGNVESMELLRFM